ECPYFKQLSFLTLAMSSVSLECYQLMLLSLRLLPSFFIICFGAVVFMFRIDMGLSKTDLDTITQFLTKDYSVIHGVNLGKPLFWTTIGLVCFLLWIALHLMLLVLLQIAGVERPAALMRFYPNYMSHKLKRRRAVSDTANFIYFAGAITFVVSLAIGLCICLSARRDITDAKKVNLAESIRKAMLSFKLKPWQGVNKTQRLIDNIQMSFGCCGLNSYHDYALEPRQTGVSWERHFYDRSMAAVAAGLQQGKHLVARPPAQSCCLQTDTGKQLNCTVGDATEERSGDPAVDVAAVAKSSNSSGAGTGAVSARKTMKLHKLGCYIRVLQYIRHRQAEAEYWSFVIGACIAAMGSMAYWAQAM
ncbi:hypothetical protein BOX15_Mlig010616g2, partial [Macrostomum lignano]